MSTVNSRVFEIKEIEDSIKTSGSRKISRNTYLFFMYKIYINKI